MFDFNDYVRNKDILQRKIEAVKTKLSKLDSMGIDATEAINKLDKAIEIVQNGNISIVLVGAFSDGKTSVAAGWMNERLEDMKISSDESSDEILHYTPRTIPQGCEIVDTPGLFGEKIGEDEAGGKVALSEKTKKYISEANLILYVVAAKNPIKDSHKDCIRWILKDLNKLSSTIFVINRMDDVADLTDDDDFQRQSEIKINNVRKRLIDCGLTQTEAAAVKIACISAAPNGKGIEEWAEHRSEYLRRSRLPNLETMINKILQNAQNDLIVKTGCDISNNELSKILAIVKQQEQDIEEIILPEKNESLKRNSKDLETLRKRICRSRNDMIEELKSLNKKKINGIRAATIDDFPNFVEDEIGAIEGKEGYVIENEVNEILGNYVEQFEQWTYELGQKFQIEYEEQQGWIGALLAKSGAEAAKGLKIMKVQPAVIKKAIFAGRDLLAKLGKKIVFKPWQAAKLAGNIAKGVPIAGAVVDALINIKEIADTDRRNKKLNEQKKKMKDSVNELFNDVIKKLESNEDFFAWIAPSYRSLEEQIQCDKEEIATHEKMLREFDVWCKSLEIDN